MKFTTHCFVRVEDAEKRKDVIEWCMHIGYEYIYPPQEERLGDKVICDTYCVGVAHDAQTFTALNCIDCGTNIELFRALAAMNNENGTHIRNIRLMRVKMGLDGLFLTNIRDSILL